MAVPGPLLAVPHHFDLQETARHVPREPVGVAVVPPGGKRSQLRELVSSQERGGLEMAELAGPTNHKLRWLPITHSDGSEGAAVPEAQRTPSPSPSPSLSGMKVWLVCG